MKLRSVGLAVSFAAACLTGGAMAPAAAVPVTIECTDIITIQPYNVGEGATDQAYLMVTGAAAGKPIEGRFPQTGSWEAAPKKPAVNPKQPVTLWKGELDNNQYVLLTVVLMQGKGQDASKNQGFMSKLANAEKADTSKGTLSSPDDLKKVAEDSIKAEQAVITKVKDTYSREKKTDHYGALCNVIVWNQNGTLQKRLDPVGLTFGEHNGNDIKIYSKLKNTRNNVLSKDEKGEWEELQFEPTSDDSTEVRVKGLETEFIPQAGGGNPLRHVTDYLMGITVVGNGKPLTWTAEDQQNNQDAIHVYWNFAD